MRRLLPLLSVLLYVTTAHAGLEPRCAASKLRRDGSTAVQTFIDCADGSLRAWARFDRAGNLRRLRGWLEDEQIDLAYRRSGAVRSAKYEREAGLRVRIRRRSATVYDPGSIGAASSPLGLHLFRSPASITAYDASGVADRRIDDFGNTLSFPSAIRATPRNDDYGQAFEASFRSQVESGNARDGTFFGDSIVQQLVLLDDQRPIWQALTQGSELLPAAISGDRVRHVLARTWAVAPTAKLIALQIGTNDHAGSGGDPVSTAEGIAHIVARVARLAPQAVILLVAIPPTTEVDRHARNQVTNSLIATLADGDRVRFIDPSPLVDMSDPEQSEDGLHFLAPAAEKWFGALAPTFAEHLGG